MTTRLVLAKTSHQRLFALELRRSDTIVAARIFGGEQLLPTASPLPLYAYPSLP
jgi:hypothetical protein